MKIINYENTEIMKISNLLKNIKIQESINYRKQHTTKIKLRTVKYYEYKKILNFINLK